MSELVVKESPKSAIAESIRVIRTNIQYTLKLFLKLLHKLL